jgi:hypothetical protein
MNDTNPEIESRFIKMMMRKSGQERLKMGFSMFDMARRQIMASVEMNKPDADVKHIRKEIFLRFYGEEFSKKERERILNRIL